MDVLYIALKAIIICLFIAAGAFSFIVMITSSEKFDKDEQRGYVVVIITLILYFILLRDFAVHYM